MTEPLPKIAPLDPIVERVRNKHHARSQVGIKKYGTTLDRDDLSFRDWLVHLQEELMDATVYIEAALNQLDRPGAPIEPNQVAAPPVNPVEQPYLDLLRDVLLNGECVPTRAVLESTGERAEALSVFGRQMRIDLAQGFPAVTTKKLAFSAVVHELIWFLSGSTNIRYLRENGVRIWDQWADEDGELGPVYGKQWRNWRGPEGHFHDQIRDLVEGIEIVKKNPGDPRARRLILTAWNVGELDEMALPPCHLLSQFAVRPDPNVWRGQRLDCQLYMRSADLFLGVPFNIASYALLTHLIAGATGLLPGELIITFGDAHIYTNHIDQVREQLDRTPYPPPTLAIDPLLFLGAPGVRAVDAFRFTDVSLLFYLPHPALKGEIAI